MKITFVLPSLGISGGLRVAAIYAEKFLELGHDVAFLAQAKPTPSRKRQLYQNLKALLELEPRWEWGDQKIDLTLVNSLRDQVILISDPLPLKPDAVPDADIIIATWWETAFAVSELPPEKGRKIYFVQHHEVHKHLPHHMSHGSYYLPLKKVVIAQWLRDVMSERYGDHDTYMVHNSVDTEQFYAPERGRQAVPTVGILYSNNPFKGVDVSLAAIDHVRKIIPDLKVVAYSTRPEHADLPLPPGAEFHLKPRQDKLRDIYASCDVWLCGSRAEGFHLPIQEAMACRCPVVSTRVGGAVESIEEGVNGYLVDVEDSQALAERLIDVLKASDDRWKSMSDAALRRVQSYTWDDAAQDFLAVLETERAVGALNSAATGPI